MYWPSITVVSSMGGSAHICVDAVPDQPNRTTGSVDAAVDEMMSSAGAFLQTGFPAVVSSLSAVLDDSTAVLMERFYQRVLAPEKTPASALRAAQRETRDDEGLTHPGHWAAFMVTGYTGRDAT